MLPEERLDAYRQFIRWLRELPDFRFQLPWYMSWCASKNHVSVCQNQLATLLASDIVPEQDQTLEFLLTCVEKVVYCPTPTGESGSMAEWRIIEALLTRRWNTTKTLWESELVFRNQRVVNLRHALYLRTTIHEDGDNASDEQFVSKLAAKLLFRIDQHYRDHNQPVPGEDDPSFIVPMPANESNIFESTFWLQSVESAFRDISGAFVPACTADNHHKSL